MPQGFIYAFVLYMGTRRGETEGMRRRGDTRGLFEAFSRYLNEGMVSIPVD